MFSTITVRQLGSSSRRLLPLDHHHHHYYPPNTYSYHSLHSKNYRKPAPVLGIAAMASLKQSYSTSVNRIPGRSSVPEEAVTNPHHVVKGKGGEVVGFKNPYPSYIDPQTFSNAMRSVFIPLLTGQLKRPDTKAPRVKVQKPEWLPTRSSSPALRATWLGHACYYVEYPSGLRVLFDPVFEDRCSPFRFMGPKRYTKPPCNLADIPVVDAILISHSHYDHLSHSSIVELKNRHPQAQFFVGLGLEKWFRGCGVDNVTEMDWWEDAELHVKTLEGKEVSAKISCLPAQHSSGRTGLDRDRTLWASWAVSSASKSVWFAGDTGYRTVPRLAKGMDDYGSTYDSLPRCPQFKQIGDLRGPFDLGLIPIGAYYPRAAFSAVHANPFDSVEIFKDTKCRRAMGIHWGTWALTMEEVLEPPAMLREALRRKRIPELGVFDVCDVGESREF